MKANATTSLLVPMLLGALAVPGNAMSEEKLITEFTNDSPDLGFRTVNDNVMGGRSDGDFVIEAGELRFAGSTNTVGGGFSSIRSAPIDLDLAAYAGIRLKVRGDGRRYTWRLTTDARVYGRPIAYWADFETEAGEWQTVDVPFSRFVPRFRGARLSGPPLNTSQIEGMGLMIYDNLDGRFELQLASVHAYRAAFELQSLRWRNRVLVVSAARDDDARLREQLELIASSPAEFNDRDLALVALVGSGTSSARGQALTDAEADELREQLEIAADAFTVMLIGKDGSVKLNSNEPVPPAEIYALIDTMPMRQREME